jgi:hypothetical protein
LQIKRAEKSGNEADFQKEYLTTEIQGEDITANIINLRKESTNYTNKTNKYYFYMVGMHLTEIIS